VHSFSEAQPQRAPVVHRSVSELVSTDVVAREMRPPSPEDDPS
jgi:hypothetical protein